MENGYDGKIEFNYEQFGGGKNLEDEHRLMIADPELYCLRACHKIGFYLQKIHKVDLLRMKVQFTQDDNGKIWFTHAFDIYTRSLGEVQSYLSLLIPTFTGGQLESKT